jgi:hypothetical protein
MLLPSCGKCRVATKAKTDNVSIQKTDSSPLIRNGNMKRIIEPPKGQYYHGVYPGGRSGEEDDIEESDLLSYESKEIGVARKAAWVYFSHNWFRDGSHFPRDRAEWISRDGKRIPFIRLMLRDTTEQNKLEIDSEKCKVTKQKNWAGDYTLDNILSKQKFRDGLLKWGEEARKFEQPLIVEWGTEMNGYWFPWNGWWNGKADGTEKFKQAYRHIVKLIRDESGALNVTWVFHVNGSDDPDPLAEEDNCSNKLDYKWNRFENYYPGDDVVDWLGVSIYGAQEPTNKYCPSFKSQMEHAYDRLSALTPQKPIFILEFGATMNNPYCGPQPNDPQCQTLGGAAGWANDALTSILTNTKWRERLRGFSWWNETWENDSDPKNNTNMRVQDVPCLKEVFRQHLMPDGKPNEFIVDTPIFEN